MTLENHDAAAGSEYASEAFPRARRLQKRATFREVYARGRKLYGRHLVLFALENRGAESRLGITVTRRLGGATLRNRVRRRLREMFRRQVAHRAAGWDFVVNVRNGTAEASFSEVERDFIALAERLGGRC